MAINNHLLGKRIRKLRSERKMSQLQLAEKIGKSPTSISYLERGEKGIRLETLILIADALDVSLDALLLESRKRVIIDCTSELTKAMEDCTPYEKYVLNQCIIEIKRILREGDSLASKDIHD